MVKTASFWLWRRQWGCFLPTWSKYSITLLAQVDCGFPWHAMSPDWKYKLYIITVQVARRLGWWSWCLIVSWWANNEIHFNYTQPQLHTILICLNWDVKFLAMMTELLLKNCIINALFAVFIQISQTRIMITVVKNMYRCMWKWHQPASPHEEDWCHHLAIVRCVLVPTGLCCQETRGKNRHNAHSSYVIRSHLLSSPRHTGDASLYLPEKIICCDKVLMTRFYNFVIPIPHSLIKVVPGKWP